jgi:hypothetical protein
LVAQLAVLAIATVGAVAFDSAEGRREVERRQGARGLSKTHGVSAAASAEGTPAQGKPVP